MKYFISKIPILGSIQKRIYNRLIWAIPFSGSRNYWKNRYKIGNTSGSGSYNKLAKFKSEILNSFVKEKCIEEVIELGCGDGNQLQYMEFIKYIGYDVSPRAIKLCKSLFNKDSSKSFFVLDSTTKIKNNAKLTISLDVIFHLVEDSVFEEYMGRLFDSSINYVCIYSSNFDATHQPAPHVKHRNFSKWIDKNMLKWKEIRKIKNIYPYNGNDEETSFCDFYFYEKNNVTYA